MTGDTLSPASSLTHSPEPVYQQLGVCQQARAGAQCQAGARSMAGPQTDGMCALCIVVYGMLEC